MTSATLCYHHEAPKSYARKSPASRKCIAADGWSGPTSPTRPTPSSSRTQIGAKPCHPCSDCAHAHVHTSSALTVAFTTGESDIHLASIGAPLSACCRAIKGGRRCSTCDMPICMGAPRAADAARASCIIADRDCASDGRSMVAVVVVTARSLCLASEHGPGLTPRAVASSRAN